jgi:hypothetical protein
VFAKKILVDTNVGSPALPPYLNIGISNLVTNETSLGHGLDKDGARVVFKGENWPWD